ncbi:uncharacterized protein LOC142523471 [Primulina tabacum]|uniref:uncharacterized protein LOC142523471 n=1 Tax=Primulina tabacum TaxID=48773 RepID=UPI003F5979D4
MSAYTNAPNALGLPMFGRENIFFTVTVFLSRSRCGLSLRDFAFRGIVMAAASVASTITVMRPPSSMSQGGYLEKLLFKSDGYNYWMWPGRKIHYVVEGEGSPLFLFMDLGLLHINGGSERKWILASNMVPCHIDVGKKS